jgi:hypothetical protein
MGIITAMIAANKGRNAVGWFLFGFFFHIIAIIVVCVVSNKKEERARYQRATSERRRLREELKMERMRTKKALGLTDQRLAMHDRALGVDTSRANTAGALPVAPPVRPVTGPAPSKKPVPLWHYVDPNGEKVGPVDFRTLTAAFLERQVNSETTIWKAGWAQWRRLGDVDGLLDALESA